MSKKATPAVNASANTTVIAHARSASPQVQFGMDIDLRLNKDDLVNLAVSKAEETLIVERETSEQKLSEAVKQHTAAVARLNELAQLQLDSYAMDEDTRTLLTSLQRKTGHAYTVKLVNNSRTGYSRYDKDKDNTPDVDVNKLAIVGTAQVVRVNDTSYNSAIVSWEVSIPFPPAMKNAVQAIRDQTNVVNRIKNDLAHVNRMIYDIPRLKNRAMSDLTIAIGRGEVKTAADAIDVVMKTQSKALPALSTATLRLIGPGSVITDDAADDE